MCTPEVDSATRNPVEAAGDLLLSKMWATAGSRFHASRRLKAMNRWSLAATSALSGYVIIASAIPLIIPLGLSSRQNGLLNVILIGVALFILVLTLLESSNSYELRSERLHECATEISELRNSFDIQFRTERINAAYLLEVQKAYDGILRRFPVNHDPVDYRLYKIQYPAGSSMGKCEVLWTRIEHFCRPRIPYLLLIIAPVLALYRWVL
jgi:hypothetical protein